MIWREGRPEAAPWEIPFWLCFYLSLCQAAQQSGRTLAASPSGWARAGRTSARPNSLCAARLVELACHCSLGAARLAPPSNSGSIYSSRTLARLRREIARTGRTGRPAHWIGPHDSGHSAPPSGRPLAFARAPRELEGAPSLGRKWVQSLGLESRLLNKRWRVGWWQQAARAST